jgi:hypothetical protein
MKIFGLIVMTLVVAVVAMAAQPVAGDWNAVIKAGEVSLRLALHVKDSQKGLEATFDSIDQKVMGMPVDKIEVKGQEVRFEIGAIQSVYTGTLNAGGTAITGSWAQLGMNFPVDFKKAAGARK